MRYMLDALEPNRIPLASVNPKTLIATYVRHSGNPNAVAQAKARFPRNQLVTISSHGLDLTNILDVERGAIEPSDKADIQRWVAQKWAMKQPPILYCSESTIPQVQSYFTPQVMPAFWEANWNGVPRISLGTIAHQYDGVPGYDISVLLDFIPGIDKADPMANAPSAQDIAHAIMSYPLTNPAGDIIFYGDAVVANEYYLQKLTAKYAPSAAPKPAPPK